MCVLRMIQRHCFAQFICLLIRSMVCLCLSFVELYIYFSFSKTNYKQLVQGIRFIRIVIYIYTIDIPSHIDFINNKFAIDA